jgi:hypothetical protein
MLRHEKEQGRHAHSCPYVVHQELSSIDWKDQIPYVKEGKREFKAEKCKRIIHKHVPMPMPWHGCRGSFLSVTCDSLRMNPTIIRPGIEDPHENTAMKKDLRLRIGVGGKGILARGVFITVVRSTRGLKGAKFARLIRRRLGHKPLPRNEPHAVVNIRLQSPLVKSKHVFHHFLLHSQMAT